MGDNPYRIKITGYRAGAEKAIEYLFDRWFIDLAGIDEVGPEFVLIVGDEGYQTPEKLVELIPEIDKLLSGYWVYGNFEVIRREEHD
jgi:hypothetical protein